MLCRIADFGRLSVCGGVFAQDFTAEGSLFFDFHTRPVLPEIAAGQLAPQCRDRDNLKRILSETDNGVNRRKKILKVIRPCQVGKIIAFNTLS